MSSVMVPVEAGQLAGEGGQLPVKAVSCR